MKICINIKIIFKVFFLKHVPLLSIPRKHKAFSAVNLSIIENSIVTTLNKYCFLLPTLFAHILNTVMRKFS